MRQLVVLGLVVLALVVLADGKPAGKPDLNPDKIKAVIAGLEEAEKEKIKSLLDALDEEKDKLTELAAALKEALENSTKTKVGKRGKGGKNGGKSGSGRPEFGSGRPESGSAFEEFDESALMEGPAGPESGSG